MNTASLRRSLLALSIAAATATANASPAIDLNHDLSSGAYSNTGDTFSSATFSGTSQNAGVELIDVTVLGNLTNSGKLQAGQSLTVSANTLNNTATGELSSTTTTLNATGNFTKVVQRIPVKLTFAADNPLKGKIRPGMSVTVKVNIKDPVDGR